MFAEERFLHRRSRQRPRRHPRRALRRLSRQAAGWRRRELSAIKDLPDEVITPEFLFEIGEAVVVDVKPERLDAAGLMARDAFLVGRLRRAAEVALDR